MKEKHAQLQDIAIRWLYGVSCSIFAKEVPTINGVADALGVKTLHGKDDVYYLECKASRSDLICKKQKAVYQIATGMVEKRCYIHSWKQLDSTLREGWESCDQCKELAESAGDTGVDFYYIAVADGVTVEPELYPMFGVIDGRGTILRKAKRMQRNERANRDLIVSVAHVLVYKSYGKLYIGEQTA